MSTIISKSEYLMFLKHPAWLWLKKHDKDKLPAVDDNTQAVFDAGHMFEKYAESLFPGIVTVGFEGFDEYKTMPERTLKVLNQGAKIISQGRFESGNITCICDILVKISANTFDLYEIKSSTKVKPEHELDLAFQMVVLEACGYKVNKIAVIHVNSSYMRNGDVKASQITTTTDITEKVKEKREETKENIAKALEVIASREMPNISPSLARGEGFSDWLDIYRSLAKIEPESIYDLFMVTADKIGKLEELKIEKLIDIHDDFPLTDKQRHQVLATKNGKETIDKVSIKKFLKNLKYPLYFLDYETLSSVIPYFDGMNPYQQIPFQYSLHVLDKPGGELKHFMYLHKDNSNPAKALSRSLKANTGKEGTVLTWSESFEKNCNKSLGQLVPEFETFFEELNERIDDLMIPFSSNWYVHKDFGGSASIKKVLPVLVTELSYKELGIHEGATAQRLWMEAVLDGKRNGEKDKILADLEEYCKLDTLAMVEIYRQLLNI
ncbi:MAG: DUF2779 domain-containing protein [Candidatus Woykebacteria bacterium]